MASDLAFGQQTSEKTSYPWRAVGDAASDLTGLGIEPMVFRADSDAINLCANCPLFSLISNVLQISDQGKIHITWDKPDELEEYIRKLQQAAEKLTTENRRLRKQHTDICDKVRSCDQYAVKSNLHYTRGITEKGVSSDVARLRGLASGQHSSEKRRSSVVCITGPRIEPHAWSYCFPQCSTEETPKFA